MPNYRFAPRECECFYCYRECLYMSAAQVSRQYMMHKLKIDGCIIETRDYDHSALRDLLQEYMLQKHMNQLRENELDCSCRSSTRQPSPTRLEADPRIVGRHSELPQKPTTIPWFMVEKQSILAAHFTQGTLTKIKDVDLI